MNAGFSKYFTFQPPEKVNSNVNTETRVTSVSIVQDEVPNVIDSYTVSLHSPPENFALTSMKSCDKWEWQAHDKQEL